MSATYTFSPFVFICFDGLFLPPTRCQYHYSTLANWTMTSSFPMLGTLFVPYFLFGRLHGSRLIRTKTPIDALAGTIGFEPMDHGVKVHCLTTWLRPYIIYIIPHLLYFVKMFFIYSPMNNAIVCSSIPYLVGIAG